MPRRAHSHIHVLTCEGLLNLWFGKIVKIVASAASSTQHLQDDFISPSSLNVGAVLVRTSH